MAPVRVKICGITRPQDAYDAACCGADAIGLVFYPPSSRYLDDLGLARQIAEAAGPFTTVVGLFVDPSEAELARVLRAVPLHLLQLHGDESPAFCARLATPYIKAIRMREETDPLAEARRYPEALGFLLDTYVAGTPGGTGQCFNWQRFPRDAGRPFVLAGGLTPENVAEGVRSTQPYAVDVSGGVEVAPGVKDRNKIQAFIAGAKSGVVSA